MTSRYNRHIILSEIGQEGQDKISNAKVLVVGAGGLGCPVLQYLAAAGVGTIGIIDFDVVEKSNLQRQILFGNSSIGKNKALAAKERLDDLNNEIEIIAYAEALTYQNAIELFQIYDIIVDGSDNFETRYLVNDACIITSKPLVFGAIYKFEGQVSVFNYNNGPSCRCLFPNPPEKNAIPNCSEIGVLGVLPGIIGTMQANEVLKLIIGLGDVLSGKLLCFNALNNKSTILKYSRNEEEIKNVLNGAANFGSRKLNIDCSPSKSVSFFDSKDNYTYLIDVREKGEQPIIKDLKVVGIPLSQLHNNLDFFDSATTYYFFCQSGKRSLKAVEFLNEMGYQNCYSMTEGASEINEYIENKILTNER